MEITNRIINALAAFRKTNSGGGTDPNAFLKYGSNRMQSKWSTPEINDEDFYTGYGFAVINKRANRSVVLGKKFLFTEATEEIMKSANDKGTSVTHPYLDLIHNSIDFSERDFWYDISTYLDLEGIYYLMAVRTVTQGGKVGNIQKFTMLNPYWVKPVVNTKGELGGYAEANPIHGNRVIPKEMIIPISLLNPFNPSQAYSLADAARDSQFTLKQANDFARESIDGNLNAPGILSSAIELPDDQFDNFVSRIKNHGRGEPLFGNGSGTISWTDMQTDLDKAALDKINSINRDVLLAVSGLSKTGVGVEESGTGREVSRTQKDDFTENAVMPQIENIIDALNLDYRRFYGDQYTKNHYIISLDNPLETNRDAEQADVDIRDSQFTLFQSLLAKGYSIDIASKYAKGKIDITDLGEPTEEIEPVVDPAAPVAPADPVVDPPEKPAAKKPVAKKPVAKADYKDKSFDVYEGYPIPINQYLGEHAEQFNSINEAGSFIYSTEEVKKVIIQLLKEVDNTLIAVVDDNTFIKLGTFAENADRATIIAKLTKRYTNQPVAVKKKHEHNHSDDIAEVIKNAVFDKQAQIDQSTLELQSSAQAAEQKLYEWYVDEINAGNKNPHPTSLEQFINSLALPFAVYFTVMFPIYASYRIQKTADDLDIKDQLPVVAMTAEIKQTIDQFAKKDATSHVTTINTDIQNALAIIGARATTPEEFKVLFGQAFAQIQARRSLAIANNAASRIFNISQYEADLQFLTRAGLVKQAYKVLFSLSGDPCQFCSSLIAETNAIPIPFTSNFVNMGDLIEADGKSMKIDYENIIAGNVHPNCRCAYRLIVKNDVSNASSGGSAVAVDDTKLPKLARGGIVQNSGPIIV